MVLTVVVVDMLVLIVVLVVERMGRRRGGGGDCDADALRSKRGREREERGGGVKKQAFASCSADSTQRAVREVACLSAIFSVVPVTVVIAVVVMACGGEGMRW